MHALFGNASGLGWVALKAALLFVVAVLGLRLGERRTLAQLNPFDFAAGAAVGAIIGRVATSSNASFVTGAVALATLLIVHRLVAALRWSRAGRALVDSPARVLVADGRLQPRELRRAGLTEADLHSLLRQQGVQSMDEVGYVLYETKGALSISRAGRQPGPLIAEVTGGSRSGVPAARPVSGAAAGRDA